MTSKLIEISKQEYFTFRDFLAHHTGILLGDNKLYLVSSRLQHIFSEYNLTTLELLVQKMSRPDGNILKDLVIEAMTTNETNWFRDAYPYQMLSDKILPEYAKSSLNQPLRIWSSACSSGQEPYTISMVLSEYLSHNLNPFRQGLQIIGTDISSKMLIQAEAAEYDYFAMARGMSSARLNTFFDKVGTDKMKLHAREQKRVVFKKINLLSSYASLGKFHIIFCRNVLIYFSSAHKTDILNRLSSSLYPGGYLFLGASESIGQDNHNFEMIKCNPGIVYKKML